MTLSEAAKNAIINSEQINNAERENRARQQAEQDQAEKEYNDLVRQQADYERQLAEQQAQELKSELLRKEMNEKIAELETKRNESLKNIPRTQTITRPGQDEIRPASRKQLAIYENKIYNRYESEINKVKRDYSYLIDQAQLQETYPNAKLGRSALNTYQSNQGKTSMIELYEKQQRSLQAKQQRQRETAIAQSAGQLAEDKGKWNQTVAKIEQEKKSEPIFIFSKEPTRKGDLEKKSEPPQRTLTQPAQEIISPDPKNKESFDLQQKLKNELLYQTTQQRSGDKPITIQEPLYDNKSDAFLTAPPPKPESIIGSTSAKSKQAVFTFEETQKQQRELSQKLSKAKTADEAIKIKEEYQKINPYVGTPQTANTKQGKAEQGVLIEKKIESTKQELDDYFTKTETELAETKTTQTETTTSKLYWTIPDPKNPGQNLKNKRGKELRFQTEESATLYIEKTGLGKTTITTTQTETQKPITYEFVNEKGQTIPPTIELLWSKMKENMTEAPTPTKSDTEFNAHLREQLKANPNLVVFPEPPQGAKTLFADLPFEQGILNHATELNYSIQNLFRSKENQIQYEHTLEGAAYSDLDQSAGNLLLNEKNEPSNNAQKYIDENLKTLEGQQKLAGSIVGSLVVLGASFVIPPIAYAKYAAKFITPKNLKRAEAIAQELRWTEHQETNKLPTTLDDMNAILRENKKAVGVEMLNPNTALIKRGTETNPEQTAYILLRFGGNKKQALASLYQGYQTDRPGSYREIVISGKQNKELRFGKRQGKEIVTYPSTLENFKKAYDPRNLAGVGSKQDVLLSDLEKHPKQVIKSVESQEEIKGSVLLETQRLSKEASKQGTALSKDAGDTYKGDLGSKELDYYLPQKNIIETTPTKTKKYEAPTDKSKPDLPSTGKPDQILESRPTKGGDLPGEKINLKIDREKLRDFVNTDVIQTSSNISNLTMTGSISGTLAATRSKTEAGFRESAKTATGSRQRLETFQETKIDLDVETKTKPKYNEMEKIILEIEQIKERRQILDPRFSLITSTETILDETQKESTTTKEVYRLKERLEEIYPRPTPTEEKTTFTKPPKDFIITLDLGEKEIQEARKKGAKPKIMYFRWNTNTEEVGQYLPTNDLTTGKTSKVIKKIDKLQRELNKATYDSKQTQKHQQKESRFFKLGTKDKNPPMQRKSFIINISEPKGKKARKFLKQFKFDMDL